MGHTCLGCRSNFGRPPGGLPLWSSRRDADRWYGPAVVLAAPGSRALWLSYLTSLLKVAPEHVRLATAEENISQAEVVQQIAAISGEAKLPTGQQQSYDIAGQEPPPTLEFPTDEVRRRPPPAVQRP